MIFGICLDICGLHSVSFGALKYEDSDSFIQFHEKCSSFLLSSLPYKHGLSETEELVTADILGL